MKILLFVVMVLGFVSTHASTLTLSTLLRAASEHNALSKSLDQNTLATRSQSLADTADNPFELYGEGTKAVPDAGKQGYEYAVGISKNIKLGNIQTQERDIANLQSEATRLDGQKRLINFKNSLKNMYHQHCIDVQKYRSMKQSYADLLKLYKKKQKAYKYQEISKIELMQLQGEKNTLFAQLEEVKMMQNISKQKVLMLSSTNVTKHTQLSCRDMYPIRDKVSLGKRFTLSKEAKHKRIQSTQKSLKRYSHAFESISVSGQYAKELDTDRYTIGVSLPLNFSSSKNEHAKAAAMYKASAIEYGYEQNIKEKKALLSELQSQLATQARMSKALSKNYRTYKKKLIPLVKKSYDLGEISVIEYLLNRQKLYTLNQEVYASKKAYYNTLFRLYTLSEKKD